MKSDFACWRGKRFPRTSRVRAATLAAIAARENVMKAGEKPSSAMRVAGRVAPKMTMPTKPIAIPASGRAGAAVTGGMAVSVIATA